MTQITLEEASKLNTERLLTYFKKYGHSWTGKFMEDNEFVWDLYDGMEAIKADYDRSYKYWSDIREILNKRENV